MAIKVKSLRETSRVNLFFIRPILDWREIYVRFFRMIQEGLGPHIPVQVSEFSGFPGAVSVGDLRARWSIYGGASSVTLFADRIEFDFPVLLPSDSQLAWFILRTVHDQLPKMLDNWHYDRIETNTFEHLELPPEIGVSAYLARYKRPEVEAAFADANAVYEPALKFRFKSEDVFLRQPSIGHEVLHQHAGLFDVFRAAAGKKPSQQSLAKGGCDKSVIKTRVEPYGS